MVGYEKPGHPLITLIDTAKIKPQEIQVAEKHIFSNLYMVNLKHGDECKMHNLGNYRFKLTCIRLGICITAYA